MVSYAKTGITCNDLLSQRRDWVFFLFIGITFDMYIRHVYLEPFSG